MAGTPQAALAIPCARIHSAATCNRQGFWRLVLFCGWCCPGRTRLNTPSDSIATSPVAGKACVLWTLLTTCSPSKLPSCWHVALLAAHLTCPVLSVVWCRRTVAWSPNVALECGGCIAVVHQIAWYCCGMGTAHVGLIGTLGCLVLSCNEQNGITGCYLLLAAVLTAGCSAGFMHAIGPQCKVLL